MLLPGLDQNKIGKSHSGINYHLLIHLVAMDPICPALCFNNLSILVFGIIWIKKGWDEGRKLLQKQVKGSDVFLAG